MALRLARAVAVRLRGTEWARHAFHRRSLGVWAVWLVPYVAGAVGTDLR